MSLTVSPSPADAFFERYGFPAPPEWSDMSGYEALMDAILGHDLANVEGDIVEIGVFLGGGTYKLSSLLERIAPHKTVYAVDVFDPSFDATECSAGTAMHDVYYEWLKGRDQAQVFEQLAGWKANVTTIVGDSATVEFPFERVAFGFIDGNHSAEYVRSDFGRVWERTSPGGVVGFHDYGFDLPEVTAEIHRLIGENADEIERIWTNGYIIFFKKKPA